MALFRLKPSAPLKREQAAIDIPVRSKYTLNPDSAVEGLSAVFRCVQVISHSTANLEIEKLQNGNVIGEFSGFAYNMTDREFLSRTATSLATYGNAYWRKPVLKLKSWKYTDVIHPSWVSIRPDGLYQITYPSNYLGGAGMEILDDSQITHIRFLATAGARLGSSPLSSLRSTLSFARDLNDYAASIYTDGQYPSGYLSTDQQLPPTVAEGVKKSWREKFAKAERDIAVLTGGLKYEALSINPTDAAFVEAFNLSVQDIGRAFGVPASFMGVGSGDSLNYTTSESETARFIQTTLMNYTNPIEDAFTADRGAASDTIEFNFDSLLRADTASRYDAYSKALASGWMTVEEVRLKEGMNPQIPTTARPASTTGGAP